MKSLRLTTSILAALLCALPVRAGEFFLGPVPVQFVDAGSTLRLDLRRFYQPGPNSKLEVDGAESIQVAYDSASLLLQLTVDSSARGLIDLSVSVRDGEETKAGVITLAVRSPQQHEFVFHPMGKAGTVFVAGSFNGWNRAATPLKADASGVFRAAVALKPGSHSYKFLVNGEWTPDKENTRQEPDGFGGMNSVLTVEDGRSTSGEGLSIFADKLEKNTLLVRASGSGEIRGASALAELPDGSSKLLQATIKPAEVILSLAGLPPGAWVRVVASDAAGRASNVIRCSLGNAGDFRWQDAIMYYALTDRFQNGDKKNDRPVKNPKVKPPANFHGGDWRGIEDKIKAGYFQKLGVNTVWIAPLNQNPAGAYQEYPEPRRWYTGYHGYWPVSATEVEPHFGDAAALKSLIKTAHENGLKVIADLVLHHVHTEHPWWKEHRDWFGTLELPDGTKNLRRWDDHQFTTWFEPYMPTFDFAKDEAVTALIDNAAWWANEYELDGFRLDAVKHIPTDFWWKFRSALREKVGAKRRLHLYLVGETFQHRAGINAFIGPNMLDGQFDFPLYDSIRECLAEEKAGLDQLEASLDASEEAFGKESLMSPLIGNHDKGRFMAYADRDLPDPKGIKEEEVGWTAPPRVDNGMSYARIKLAQAFLLTIDGVPMIYYGDEFGMTGAGDPDNRRAMRFGDELSEAEQDVLANFQLLTKIRARHPALRTGSRRSVMVEKEMLAFVRAELADRVLCVFNRAPKSVERELQVGPELADGSYTDEVGGTSATVKNGRMTVRLAPRSAAVFARAP